MRAYRRDLACLFRPFVSRVGTGFVRRLIAQFAHRRANAPAASPSNFEYALDDGRISRITEASDRHTQALTDEGENAVVRVQVMSTHAISIAERERAAALNLRAEQQGRHGAGAVTRGIAHVGGR